MAQAYLFNKTGGNNSKIEDLLPGGETVEYYVEDGQNLNKGDYVCFEQGLDNIYFNTKADSLINYNLSIQNIRTLDDGDTRYYYDSRSGSNFLYSIKNYKNPKNAIINKFSSTSSYMYNIYIIKVADNTFLRIGGSSSSQSSSSMCLMGQVVTYNAETNDFEYGAIQYLTDNNDSDKRVGYINRAILLDNGQIFIFSSNYYRAISVGILCNIDITNKTINIIHKVFDTDMYIRYDDTKLVKLSNNKIALLYQDYELGANTGKLYKYSFTTTDTTVSFDNNATLLIDSSYAYYYLNRFFEDDDGNIYYYCGSSNYTSLSIFKILNPNDTFENLAYNLMIDDIISNSGITLINRYSSNNSVYYKPIITYDKGFRWYFIIAESKDSYYIVSISKTYNSDNVGEVYHTLRFTTSFALNNSLWYSELNISDDNTLNLSILYDKYLYANLVQTVRLYDSTKDIMPLGVVTAVNGSKVKVYKFNQKYIDNFHDKMIFTYTPTSATNTLYIDNVKVKPTRFNLNAIPDSETAGADIGNIPYIYMLKYYYNSDTGTDELKTLNSYVAGNYRYTYNSSNISYSYDIQNQRIVIDYNDSSEKIYHANSNYKFILEYWREPNTTPIDLLS